MLAGLGPAFVWAFGRVSFRAAQMGAFFCTLYEDGRAVMRVKDNTPEG